MAAPRFSTPAAAEPGGPPGGRACWPDLSPIRPPRRSRLQDAEELRRLNDRLAAYIARVRAQVAAAGREEPPGEGEGCRLRLLYEGELAEARRLLDDQAAQCVALQLDLSALREEHRSLRERNSKKEKDLSLAVARIRDLDARLQSRGAELATALSRQRGLEKDLQESESQITSLKKTVADTRNQLQNERLKMIDREHQTQMLREQITFLKTLHENELKTKKSFYQSKIQEIESGHQQEYQNRLLDDLQGLRQEHEQQIKAYKERVEWNFAAKVENAQISAVKNRDLANSTWEELKITKLRTDALTSQNAALEARINELEARVQELEKTIDCERDTHRRCVTEKNREMVEAQRQMQAQLEEYEHLLDVKLALDLEISAYQGMLEREEKRLGLSRPSSESISMHSSASRSRLFLQGKKRKRTTAEKQGPKGVQCASSSGSISVEETDVEGNFVRIKNNLDQDQSLSGWTLRRVCRTESDTMYEFPTGFTLQAGQEVIVGRTRDDLQKVGLVLVWQPQGSRENVNIILLNAKEEETAGRKITYAERGGGGGGGSREGEEKEEEAAEEEVATELYTQQNGSHICPIM